MNADQTTYLAEVARKNYNRAAKWLHACDAYCQAREAGQDVPFPKGGPISETKKWDMYGAAFRLTDAHGYNGLKRAQNLADVHAILIELKADGYIPASHEILPVPPQVLRSIANKPWVAA